MTLVSNPIIVREVRARWRTWGSPILLLLLLSALALAMSASYSDQMGREHLTDGGFTHRVANRSGREIFIILSFIQAGAWMLLAPVLTAMNIAGERERGLLESLQLSPLRPRQIIGGKLFSAVAFILLTSLVTLPIIGLTFLMGGVSPGEFFGVFALHGSVAVAGASLGMFFSSRSRRPLPALISSVVAMGVWFFGSGLALFLGEEGFDFWPFYASPTSPFFSSLTDCMKWIGFANPLLSTFMIVDPREMTRGGTLLPVGPDFPYWTICPAFCLVVTAWSLWGAMRAVRKPFAPVALDDHHWLQLRGAKKKSGIGTDSRVFVGDAESLLVRDRPLNGWVKFANPILRREVRGAFRFRRSKVWQGLAQVVFAALVFAGLFLIAFDASSSDYSRRGWWEFLTNLGLFLLMASCALWSARSFTRERESGMAEGLGLSLLSPWEIVSAKLFAPLLTFAIFSIPVCATLLFCIDWVAMPNGYNTPPDIGEALCAGAVVATTCFFVTAFGLLVSHCNARTVNAVIIVIVTLIVVWGVAPVFLDSTLRLFFGNGQATEDIINVTNPFGALNSILALDYENVYVPSGPMPGGDERYFRLPNTTAWIFCVLAFLGGGLCLLLLLARLKHLFPAERRALNDSVSSNSAA